MISEDKITYITNWLNDYCISSKQEGFVIGISGGIDSAVTSALCVKTGKQTLLVNLPLRQNPQELKRACDHIEKLTKENKNVRSITIDLSKLFSLFEDTLTKTVTENKLAMANSRSRLRMTTLYALAQTNNMLVVGTGNKIEDFGVGFFTKYGDGGVDISPIADLSKTEVKELAASLNISSEIRDATPTDGLWDDDSRTDEQQLGASYKELEWAMDYKGNNVHLSEREIEVLEIYKRFNTQNKHKMIPIPICKIPNN